MSPLSLTHQWKLNLTRIPSSFRPHKQYNIHSMKERRLLKVLASVGVIGKNQIRKLFSITPKELENMKRLHKIVEHELIRKGSDEKKDTKITIYTLGVNGAKAIKLDAYENNYWMLYKAEDVLKCLLFFKLYERFKANKVIPTPEPFTSAIQGKDSLIFVYILKGNVDELLRYLKFESKRTHQVIIITESLNHLKPLELFLKDLKLRVVLEEELIAGKEDVFHAYE